MDGFMEDFLLTEPTEMGIVTSEEIQALQKALLAPESTDDLYQTPGGVLTRQSLEGMLADLTLNEKDFTYWRDVNKMRAFSTVEEYDQQVGLGVSDGGFVGQIENPEFRDADFDKQIAIVKYMSEGWQVGDVAAATNTIINQKTRQQRSAMLRILRNLDMKFYNGNSAMVPEEFDGLEKTIAGQSSDQVRDIRGANISQSVFNVVAQLIHEGNGNPDNAKIYSSPAGRQNIHEIISGARTNTIQNFYSDSGDANMTIGGRINFVETPFGTMVCRTDKILGMAYEARDVPKVRNTAGSFVEGATSEKAPSIPTITLVVDAPTVTGSLFSAAGVRPSGTKQNYRVAAKNRYGRSIASVVVETGSAVGAVGAVTITIIPNQNDSGSKTPTCFEIFGEKVYGSGKFRYLTTVAADASPLADVTYQDLNLYIPETARMFVIDQTSAGEQRVTTFSQLLPIHNTNLAKIGRFDHGLINLYGVPKYYKPNVLVEIRNVNVEQAFVNNFNIV